MEACPDIYELLDNRGRTALHVAAEVEGMKHSAFSWGDQSLSFFFDEQDKEGNTLIHLAAINDQVLLSSYLKYGRFVDLNVMDKEGFTTTDNALLRWKLNSLTV